MTYCDGIRPDTATPWFAGRLSEQVRAHEGWALKNWATAVLQKLPPGRVALLSMSVEGCALAAVVASMRKDETTWEQIAVGRPQPERKRTLVVVEPIRLAEGLLESLQQLLPNAFVIEGLAAPTELASAA
jgi:hypothetical protein